MERGDAGEGALRSRGLPWGTLAALAIIAHARDAHADNPLNSNDRTAAPPPQATPQHPRDELHVLPIGGGNTDIGFGVGEVANLTRSARGYEPYVWNVESLGLVTFKPAPDGAIEVPYQSLAIGATFSRFMNTPMRLELRPSYTRETTLHYYGIGNASSDAVPDGATTRYFWYARTHPTIDVVARWRIADHVAGVTGIRYSQNWLAVRDQSKLAGDLQAGDAEVKGLLGPTRAHGVALFAYGLQWDTRDSEASTHHGSFHEAEIRFSPGGAGLFPYRYGQATAVSRAYFTLVASRVVFAVRGVADALVGHPPFYELARFDDTYAIGGANGVRGVPGQRYAGMIKVFGNAEVRLDVTRLALFGEKMRFGIVGFFDAGRVWADWSSHPELDGNGLGIKYGFGIGPRLRPSDTFVLRLDFAWSPDARPIGAYFAAGELF